MTARIVVTIVATAFASGLDTDGRAQGAPPPQERPAHPIADAVERAARELRESGSSSTADQEGALFRVTVNASPLPPAWHITEKESPVRSRYGTYQRELLTVVTPEGFRASTFYPAGISVDPGAIYHQVRGMWRDWQARRIHERVEQEVAELRARFPNAR